MQTDNNNADERLDSQPDEGVVIDVEPQVDQPQRDNTETPGRFFPWLAGSVVSLLLIMLAAGLFAYRQVENLRSGLLQAESRIAAGEQQQQAFQQQLQQARSLVARQQDSLQSMIRSSEELQAGLQLEREQLQRESQTMQQAVTEISRKVDQSNNHWQLAEAEYLMKLANHRLSLSQDLDTAIAALQQADEKLYQSGDLGLMRIRNRLADEINQLKAVSLPDVTALAATLQSLAASVNQLQPTGSTVKTATDSASEKDSNTGRNLDTLLQDSWQGFKELLVIRRHDQPVSAMLPPSQQFFLYQNLQLQIETARLALLRNEQLLFQSSLETALDWLERFFESQSPAVQHMRESLQSLQSTRLDYQLPDISQSLRLLQRYRENRS